MAKKSKKIFIFFLLLFFFLFLFSIEIFAQKELEVEYPEIQGFKPETVAVPLPDYVKYIFNFIITICGLIGFGVLIIGGIHYFTSAGNPEKIKNAKEQIKYSFLGIIILLFSYLILTTINPQLVVFREPEVAPLPSAALPSPPISEAPTPDLMGRVEKLAETIKEKASDMKNAAESLTNFIDKCDCKTTQPLCLCKDYDGGCAPDNVNPCYSAETTQPCPDDKEIKEHQLIIFAQKDDMIYYKNRALVEREDLKEDLLSVLNKKIEWFTDRIAAETEVLNQLPEGAEKQLQQKIIEILKEEKTKLETEKDYKEKLIEKLFELAEAIEKLREPGEKISELPDECLSNVSEKCQGSCEGGCHNTSGCFPKDCKGGNPCPTQEIKSEANKIADSHSEIAGIVNEIIKIISQIK